MGGIAEVELGKLAKQTATNDQVKNFGEHMVQDHSKANEELKAIASTKGVQLPAELGEKHKAAMEKLQKLSGGDFDRAYMKQMVADHKQTVADFKKQVESGKDADLKSFAAQRSDEDFKGRRGDEVLLLDIRQSPRGSSLSRARRPSLRGRTCARSRSFWSALRRSARRPSCPHGSERRSVCSP